MRTFYIFNINEDIYSLYKDNPASIYNILKQVSFINKYDVRYAKSIFIQVGKRINKSELDKRIFIDLHNTISYKKESNTHIYNNLYLDEVSTMIIKNNYIIIKSNKDFAYFFKKLIELNDRFFVCDFKNNDYFYLNKLKILV